MDVSYNYIYITTHIFQNENQAKYLNKTDMVELEKELQE